MFYHHNTIRTYTGALLNLFSDLEVQYKNSSGEIKARNIPVRFSTREKAKILDEFTQEQLTSGNYNVLPRASLSLSSMLKAEQRTTNKNLKVNIRKNENNFEFLYNSVPYEFTYELSVICRGMNEACMIIEQVASRFNPFVEIDVFDATNLDEPTRIPVLLLDIGIDSGEYEELSSNILTLSIGLSIKGNIYPPIRSIERIKEFKMFLNESNILSKTDYIKKTVFEYDVIDEKVTNENISYPEISQTSPNIIEIVGENINIGDNILNVIWEDIDSTIRELNFEWGVLSENCSITYNKDNAVLNISENGDYEIYVKITDEVGNYTYKTKIFTVP